MVLWAVAATVGGAGRRLVQGRERRQWWPPAPC